MLSHIAGVLGADGREIMPRSRANVASCIKNRGNAPRRSPPSRAAPAAPVRWNEQEHVKVKTGDVVEFKPEWQDANDEDHVPPVEDEIDGSVDVVAVPSNPIGRARTYMIASLNGVAR